jgi:hypothetical protein
MTKVIYVIFGFIFSALSLSAQQPSSYPYFYVHQKIETPGNTDYTEGVILLHEIFNGTNINENFVIGKLMAKRGTTYSGNRLNIVDINSKSAYTETIAGITAFNYHQGPDWELITCTYLAKKYLALKVPYSVAHHDMGFFFEGWAQSTSERLKYIATVTNGVVLNQEVYGSISPYKPNSYQKMDYADVNFTGNVGIGTMSPQEKLVVKGKVVAEEIKVQAVKWPDYVFKPEYKLPSLAETEKFIKAHGHLPDVPKATDVEANGVSLGEMNKILLKKVEELTLHLIDQQKQIKELQSKEK